MEKMIADDIELENDAIKKSKIYFKSIFDKYDINNSGSIELNELCNMLKDDNEVSRQLVKKLFKYSDSDGDKRIDFNEFYTMVHDEKFTVLFKRYLNNYVKFIVPPRKFYPVTTVGDDLELDTVTAARPGTFRRTARRFIDGSRTSTVDGLYEDRYTWCPPPFTMFTFSIIQIVCFIIDKTTKPPMETDDAGKSAQLFVYDPYKRQECWRFLTYMFVHIGWAHIAVNIVVQIILGLPLELVHRWWRILIVYSLGVATGSLFTSVVDPSVYLAGASGGVYSIITAHIASIIMNWKDMAYPSLHLIIILILVFADVGTSIYNRYANTVDIGSIGYAAHFGGALAGLLVGIWVLKNVDPTNSEKYIWWIAFAIYIVMVIGLIVMNIFWSSHFPAAW